MKYIVKIKIAVNPKCAQMALLDELKITWLLYICVEDIEVPIVFVIIKLHFKVTGMWQHNKS